MKPYRILSFDGGGSWALIQVRCLQQLFGPDASGHAVLRQFDLVAANSGGSIVAAGLAVNYRLSELLALFENENRRRQVFSELKWYERIGNQLIRLGARLGGESLGPKYATERKLAGLRDNLAWRDAASHGPEVLVDELPGLIGGDCPVHFLFCGFDYERRRAVFFRSDKNSRANTHVLGGKPESDFCRVSLVEAVHASTNAPINYFDRPAQVRYRDDEHRYLFWDGAVGGHNNPVKAAVVEALSNGVERERIHALSLGTGSLFRPLTRSVPGFDDPILVEPVADPKPSLFTDIPKIAGSILNDPPDAATFEAYAMLYPRLPLTTSAAPGNRLVRLNPVIQPVLRGEGDARMWELPEFLKPGGYDEFRRLVEIQMDAVRDEEVAVIRRFCQAWLDGQAPNQGIRWDGELKPVLGYPTFAEAKTAWQNWPGAASNGAAGTATANRS